MTDAPHAAVPGRTVSVVLLSYNHRATVGEALRTALDQSAPAHEVIVSDDHSTDGSLELLREIAAGDPRVRVVQPPHNVGMAANANLAVGQSTGDFVALLHHDDSHHPDMLARWADVLDRHPDIAFVFNAYDETTALPPESFPERMDGTRFLKQRLLRTWGCPVRGTTMFRRRCWDAVGGMREEYGLIADVDLWMRMSARWAVGFVDAPLIVVRHDRPAVYPDDYVGLSWRRNRTLYEIHAANSAAMEGSGVERLLRRTRLRARVSTDAAKWLAYAAMRKPALLADAEDGATRLEYAPVRLARRLAARRARRRHGSGQ